MKGKFILRITLGNDAMRSLGDIAEVLHQTAREIERYQESGAIYDYNGNSVGSYMIERA